MLPARVRVLLVEDDPVTVRVLAHILRNVPNPSFSVIHEASLAEALTRIAASADFDVAILDLNLPDSYGIGTLAQLQAAAPSLPIVIMTGDDDPTVAELALEVGAQDYLVKGEAAERIITRSIRYAISRKHADLDRQAISDRLNASLAAENKRINEETDLARAMQFELLPGREHLASFPKTRGLVVDGHFEPSSAIGGDLWGGVECDALRTVFYIVDFSGHGVGAALNVFRLHALMAELGTQIIDPAATLDRLNKVLVDLLPRGQYATIFLGVIDIAADTLTWSAGGAPPPILFDPEGKHHLLDTRGKPLGISASARYVNRAVSFSGGSCLFLYSDALTEALIASGQMLGERRMVDMVRRFQSATGITIPALVERFLDSVRSPLEDDLTAVSIARVAAETIPAAAERPQSSAPLLLTSRRLEVVDVGLAPPYSGFVEIGGDGLSDVGRGCLEAAERGGLCLSMTVAGAWACCAAALLSAAVSRRFGGNRDWSAVEMCLSESITNAIIHGGLEVPSALRETKDGLAAYAASIQERLGDSARAGKRVEVTVIPLPGGVLQITVYDRGAGFDFDATLKREMTQDAKHGRGLMLISKVAKSLVSRDGGRTLVIEI